MRKWINYLGQIRIYSVLDLVVLLIAIKTSFYQFLGAIFLHLSFIIFLEVRHDHEYRDKWPNYIWIILGVLGLILFRNISSLGYIVSSYVYVMKKKRNMAIISPFARGLQGFFIVGGITGFASVMALISFILFFIRNVLGDFRDIEKDKKERMNTLPIYFGFKESIKYLHLIGLVFTTIFWGFLGGLNIVFLSIIIIIELVSYNLTPR